MANNRANKYKDTTKEISKNAIRFDLTELDLMCAYILSDNANIHRSNIQNIKKLMGYIDAGLYVNNAEGLKRIEFITKGAEVRLNQRITNREMIIRSIYGGFGTVPSGISSQEITDLEVQWINQTVSECLKYLITASKIEEGISLFTKFLGTDYKDRGDIVKEVESFVVDLNNHFRKAKVETADDQTFSLTGDSFRNTLSEAYREATMTTNRLQFGSLALNELTGGGVYNGRTYLILGLPGEGKSSTLLDMALQIKKYNANYICKDKTKKPCVVLFVMENSIRESVERMYNMLTRKQLSEAESIDTAIALLQREINVTSDSPIDVIIKYRPNLSEDTSYLYTIYDDLADEGYEVICMIQDYIKRIRSVEGSFGGDLRMQMGAIMNEFKTFATLKDIPVITASQLNRTASSSIDEARVKNKNDLVRLIGRSNVGESNLIIENADWVGLLAPEEDDNIRYLGLSRVKSRYYIDGELVVFAPYIDKTIKLVEDMDAEMPSMKLSLRDKEFEDNMAYRSGSMNSKKIMECIEKGDPIKLVNGSFEISVGSQANKDKKEDESMVLEGDEQVVDFNTLIGEKVVRGVAGFYARNIVIRVQEMCKIIDNSRKRELCKIVSR